MPIIQGLEVDAGPDGVNHVVRFVGEENTPQDVKRLRRSVYDALRRFGQPVILKHMFNSQDIDSGVAEHSPTFNPVYGQTRNEERISHGIGIVSVVKSENEWISPSGPIVAANTSPGAGYVRAPKYRGFGPGYLTYIIQPDAAEDVFKLNPEGALIKIQTAQAQMAWFPEVNDNDLIIEVSVDRHGNVTETFDRFQAKVTSPTSIRGEDRRGFRESTYGANRFVVNQTFEMVLVPSNSVLMTVQTDR